MQVSALKLLPSRIVSRVYGAVNQVVLPRPARPLVYGAWSWFFKVRLSEIEHPLDKYEHMTAFFTRRLRAGARPIDQRRHVMVSPVDGAVVSISTDMRSNGVLSQVKGIEYHVSDFLGIPTPTVKPGNALFSAVLYLSPGDYHRFHSHTEWVAERRTHFAGQLLPVNPLVVQVLPSLFCANERVAIFGKWKHGFMSYTAVGATNVGSIRLAFDHSLVTNTYRHDWQCGFNALEAVGLYGNRFVDRPALVEKRDYPEAVPLRRGDDVGLFELGSTIVLIFEAPKDFVFTVKPGDKVTVGSPLGCADSDARRERAGTDGSDATEGSTIYSADEVCGVSSSVSSRLSVASAHAAYTSTALSRAGVNAAIHKLSYASDDLLTPTAYTGGAAGGAGALDSVAPAPLRVPFDSGVRKSKQEAADRVARLLAWPRLVSPAAATPVATGRGRTVRSNSCFAIVEGVGAALGVEVEVSSGSGSGSEEAAAAAVHAIRSPTDAAAAAVAAASTLHATTAHHAASHKIAHARLYAEVEESVVAAADGGSVADGFDDDDFHTCLTVDDDRGMDELLHPRERAVSSGVGAASRSLPVLLEIGHAS